MSEEASAEMKKLTTCQKCGKNDPNLNHVESGLKLSLAKMGDTNVPQNVCTPCLKELRKSASLGAQLQAKEEALQKKKGDLWKNRILLVKQGRKFLQRAEYAEAAVSYEKYLKIVEVVYNKSRKELDPKLFNDSPKEITIIASVLWDLMLIYDSHIKFKLKQTETAEILANFLRFTPIYNTVVRKAEKEIKKAKNPQAFRHLLKLCDAKASRCFIANAAFETRTDPTVKTLCLYRDQVLKKSPKGRILVAFYYRHSPVIAAFLDQYPKLKVLVRPVLRGVARVIKGIFPLPDSHNS